MTLINPIMGRITTQFGKRKHPITGKVGLHNGVDISAVVGTSIKAPESGKIIKVWEDVRGGRCLAMMGDSGKRYGFAHLSQQLEDAGERVAQGDVIARTGNTGASTGPHLHFTVQVAGKWVDPMLYFNFN